MAYSPASTSASATSRCDAANGASATMGPKKLPCINLIAFTSKKIPSGMRAINARRISKSMEDSNPKNAQKSGAEDTSGPDLYRNPGLFTYSENGFAIAFGPNAIQVAWAEIQALFGYKRDLYA
nr:hypothetical protein [Tanacetum cinerariifolium]